MKYKFHRKPRENLVAENRARCTSARFYFYYIPSDFFNRLVRRLTAIQHIDPASKMEFYSIYIIKIAVG